MDCLKCTSAKGARVESIFTLCLCAFVPAAFVPTIFKGVRSVKILYLDCFGGLSGDMVLGALLDAGVPLASVAEQLARLELTGYSLKACREQTHGFTGTRFLVEISRPPGLDQPHRIWEDISRLIAGSELAPPVKKRSLAVFEKLAQAEAKVHGVPPAQVHFHEVGAIDSIVDIVGTAIALHEAGIEKVYCSPLPNGTGCIRTAHGLLPVPAPAAAELLVGIPLRPVPVEGELVTPTGAALAAVLAEGFGPAPAMRIEQTGYGLGSNDYGIPNFLRVFIGESTAELTGEENAAGDPGEKQKQSPASLTQEISVLQTAIDDLNPEILAYTAEKLLAAGALDAWLTPVIMKKGRPGSLLTALCPPEKEDELRQIIFAETSTLGVRARREKRHCLPRRLLSVETGYGAVRVKITAAGAGPPGQISPEYEDCRRLAREKGVPLKKVYLAAVEAAQKTARSTARRGGSEEEENDREGQGSL